MKRSEEEEKARRAEKIRGHAAKLLRKRKEEEYKLAEAERKIRLADAKVKLADAESRKKRSEAELWRAKKEKLGAIVRFPIPSGSGRKSGKKGNSKKAAKKTLKTIGKGAKSLQKWARSGR